MATPLIRRPEGNGASPQVVPAAGRYRLDPSQTVVAFRSRHLFGLGAVSGTMAVTAGEITIDPAVPQASVTATISAASFRTGNPGPVPAARLLLCVAAAGITYLIGQLAGTAV